MNRELKEYIENNIFKSYSKNEQAHDVNHIKSVIKRCEELSENLDINQDMLYVIASYHDIGHYINAKKHEIISAEIMMKDENLKRFFNAEQLKIIKEAIEDHRASSEKEPRSIYGKLISSVDRNIDIDNSIERCYYYGKNHYPELNEEQLMERIYLHIQKKYGMNGYAKFYFNDEKYNNYLKEVDRLLNNKEELDKRIKKQFKLY